MVWVRLFLGIVACSSSVIFIKSTDMHPTFLAAFRLLIASLILFPLFRRDLRRHPDIKPGQLLKVALPAGLFLCLHFISWNQGVRYTLAAHATLIVNMVPVVLPVVLWTTHRERINRKEILATLISITGISVLAIQDYHFSKAYLLGDIVCFVSMILFAIYLSLGRKNRHVGSILLYMVPVYVIASAGCFLAGIPFWRTLLDMKSFDFLMALCLALIPTIFGHTLINLSMRALRGQIVGVMNVSQFVSAGILAYFLFGEVPPPVFYVVSAFVVASCVMVVLSHKGPIPVRGKPQTIGSGKS